LLPQLATGKSAPRDDEKERATVHEELLLDRSIFLILFGHSPDAGRFPWIGSLPGQAFGDLFEVAPEVSVQCFLGLDRGHFSYLRFSGIVEVGSAQVGLQILTAILLVAITESIPRESR
jgi:hypothetical protein